MALAPYIYFLQTPAVQVFFVDIVMCSSFFQTSPKSCILPLERKGLRIQTINDYSAVYDIVFVLGLVRPFAAETAAAFSLLTSRQGDPQSRQSAKRFSSRWNWDSPTPLPPTLWYRGGGHTRLRLKGWGSPNSNEGTFTVVLYIYKYFVGRSNLIFLKKIENYPAALNSEKFYTSISRFLQNFSPFNSPLRRLSELHPFITYTPPSLSSLLPQRRKTLEMCLGQDMLAANTLSPFPPSVS